MNGNIDDKSLQESSPEKALDDSADLRAIREAKGISLRDIFEQTRISTINLEAIESGDFSKLPAPVSGRTFIKTYARIVGVDSGPILYRYAKYLETRNAPPAVEEIEENKKEEEPLPQPQETKKGRLLFTVLIVIAAGIAAALFFLNGDSSRKTPEPVPPIGQPAVGKLREMPLPAPEAAQDIAIKPPPAVATTPKEPPLKIEPSQVPAAEERVEKKPAKTLRRPVDVSPTESGGKRRLIIEARELTWLRIREDQNPSYQVMLQPGEKIERFAEQQFQLDVGNAAGIDVTFEGKPLGKLGKSSEVVHLTLP